MRVPERVSATAGVPLTIARAVAKYGLGTMQNTAELLLSVSSSEELVHSLEKEQFDHNVQLATGTYEAGRRKKDPELGFFGGGWLLKLMCEGNKNAKVPKRKVEEIARYVAEQGLDPMLEPCLSDEEAITASAIMRKKQPIREVFFLPPADT